MDGEIAQPVDLFQVLAKRLDSIWLDLKRPANNLRHLRVPRSSGIPPLLHQRFLQRYNWLKRAIESVERYRRSHDRLHRRFKFAFQGSCLFIDDSRRLFGRLPRDIPVGLARLSRLQMSNRKFAPCWT